MGFFDRITNVWRGFLSLWVSNVETKNPEAVYEAAIEERIRQHRDLKKAVASIVYLRNKTETELEERETLRGRRSPGDVLLLPLAPPRDRELAEGGEERPLDGGQLLGPEDSGYELHV